MQALWSLKLLDFRIYLLLRWKRCSHLPQWWHHMSSLQLWWQWARASIENCAVCVMASLHSVVPPSSSRSRASCFMTCLCLEVVGETVCIWSARHTIHNPYDCNCLDVKCACSWPCTLGHLTAPVAALLYPLMHGFCGSFRAMCVRSRSTWRHALVYCMMHSGRERTSLWQSRSIFSTMPDDSEYLHKLYCFGMVNMKSGSLIPKGAHFLWLFCRNCRCAPNLYDTTIACSTVNFRP